MTERITKQDLQRAVEALQREMDHAGITFPNGRRLALQEGSKTYGRAWRLHGRDPESGGLHDDLNLGGWGGYIGWTGREALQSIEMLRAGLRLGTGA